MGYEVLDTTGAVDRPPAPRPGPPPSDVVDLEAPPGDPPGAPPRDGRPQGGGRPRWASGRRGVAALAGLALVAAAVGASWGEHRSRVQRTAAADVRVVAVAQSPDMAQFGRFSAASVRVSLLNLGERPVEVVTSWPGARPTAGTTLVGLATGSARIAPGGSQPVVVVVGISCQDDVPVTPQLQVRDEQGDVHDVSVRDDALRAYRVRPGQVCGLPDGVPLAASVTGSLRSPTLLLRNGTHHDLQVGVDAESAVQQRPPVTGQVQQSTQVGAIGPALTAVTTPRLPVVVRAGETTELGLGVQVRGCSVLPSLRRTAWLTLRGDRLAVDHGPPEEVTARVDLSALVGAELADLCD